MLSDLTMALRSTETQNITQKNMAQAHTLSSKVFDSIQELITFVRDSKFEAVIRDSR